jgi:hypothetical protein
MEEFKSTIAHFLTQEESMAILAAENNYLFVQVARILDVVVRRMTLRFAELIGFPSSSLADIIEPRMSIKAGFSCLVLDINSRNLKGHVAFRVSEAANVIARFPTSVLDVLEETRQFWKLFVYLEPLYDREGKILRSTRRVRNVYAKPKDPIICAYLGSGMSVYGYKLPYSFSHKHNQIKAKAPETRDIALLIAHWD